jgi:release factor glutamine methyltransferase
MPRAREGTAAGAVDVAARRLAAASIHRPRAEAEILVRWAAGLTREQLLVHPEKQLTAEAAARLGKGVRRREQREPLPYILGEAEFYSLPFHVSPAVLVPRPETERLAEAVVERARQAVVLARELPALRVIATDVSPAALAVARHNAQRHGVRSRVDLVRCDLLSAIGLPVDGVVANPPYIRHDEFEELEPEVRDYEPRLALNGGLDGLGIVQRLTVRLAEHLNTGGFAALEVGAGQAEAVANLMVHGGLSNIELLPDYAGIARVVIGWRRGETR